MQSSIDTQKLVRFPEAQPPKSREQLEKEIDGFRIKRIIVMSAAFIVFASAGAIMFKLGLDIVATDYYDWSVVLVISGIFSAIGAFVAMFVARDVTKDRKRDLQSVLYRWYQCVPQGMVIAIHSFERSDTITLRGYNRVGEISKETHRVNFAEHAVVELGDYIDLREYNKQKRIAQEIGDSSDYILPIVVSAAAGTAIIASAGS